MTWLDRLLCGLTTRHRSALLQYGAGRLWLRCECGWTSKGWTVQEPRNVTTARRWQRQIDTRRRKVEAA